MTRIVKQDFEVILEELRPWFPRAKHLYAPRLRHIRLTAWNGADEAGATEVTVENCMYTVKEWSTSEGVIWKYSHQDRESFIEWVINNLEEK